jgi:hypothetical protein
MTATMTATWATNARLEPPPTARYWSVPGLSWPSATPEKQTVEDQVREELSRPVDGGCGVQSVTAPPGDRIGVCERVERVVDRLVLVGEHRDLVVFGAACPVTTPRVPLKTPSALILL